MSDTATMATAESPDAAAPPRKPKRVRKPSKKMLAKSAEVKALRSQILGPAGESEQGQPAAATDPASPEPTLDTSTAQPAPADVVEFDGPSIDPRRVACPTCGAAADADCADAGRSPDLQYHPERLYLAGRTPDAPRPAPDEAFMRQLSASAAAIVMHGERPGMIHLYRVGEHFRAFHADARAASDVLAIPLLSDSALPGKSSFVNVSPCLIAGVVKELIAAGHRVGLCEWDGRVAGGLGDWHLMDVSAPLPPSSGEAEAEAESQPEGEGPGGPMPLRPCPAAPDPPPVLPSPVRPYRLAGTDRVELLGDDRARTRNAGRRDGKRWEPADDVDPATLIEPAPIPVGAERKAMEREGRRQELLTDERARAGQAAANAHRAAEAAVSRPNAWHGHVATSLARWLGKAGWRYAEVRLLFDRLGLSATEGTLRAQVAGGVVGRYGPPAALTDAQAAELAGMRPKPEELPQRPTPSAEPRQPGKLQQARDLLRQMVDYIDNETWSDFGEWRDRADALLKS